jgi:hypothetical protein
MSVGMLVRKNVCLDSGLIEQVNAIAKAKGGARMGASFSAEVTIALKEYVQRRTMKQEEITLAPVLERLFDEKFSQLEQWLRPGTWGGATYSATSALLLLELMCGKKLDPSQAKEHFDLIRGRAWKIVRRPTEEVDDDSKS